MIKRILLAGSFLLFTLLMSAQYKPMLFGLRTGGSIDWMKPDVDQYESDGIRLGFSWGFTADFFLMENYSILTGFNVQYLHGKLKFPVMEVNADDTVTGTLLRNYNLQYIQIPVVLKMQAEISERVRLFGKIGLGTAFRIRAKAEDVLTPDEGNPIESEKDILDEVSVIRESFLIGGGAAFVLKGSTALVVDLTFDNGFINILKGENSLYPDVKQKAVLNFVELGVGILF